MILVNCITYLYCKDNHEDYYLYNVHSENNCSKSYRKRLKTFENNIEDDMLTEVI